MSSQNQDDEFRGENTNHHRKRSPNEPADIPIGSPDGSQASQSSSTTRRNAQRIVELLPEFISRQAASEAAGGQDNWVIGAEFYHEDIGAENERMSDDGEEVGDQDLAEHIDGGYLDDDDDFDEEVGDEEVDDDDDADYDDDEEDMGFVLAHVYEDSDTDDDEELGEGNDVDNGAANYDTTLPVCHPYLGDFEDSGGMQIFAENSILTIPSFNLRHIVLLPGQKLPIKTTATDINRNMYESLRDLLSRGTTLIGLMSHPRQNNIGTTAEIRSYRQGESELTLILEGRQRFQLLSPPFDTLCVRMVRILPEISLGRPYLLPPSRRKLLLNNGANLGEIVSSRHPLWLLKKYEATNIAKNILEQIRNWYPVDLTMRGPNYLSYWVAANLPLSNQERMTLLKFNCTEQRLLWLQEYLQASEYLGCCACKNVISCKKDIFTMTSSGLQTSFINEHGFVHDTLTVRATAGLIQSAGWSEEWSWFPGYKWAIVCCDRCNRHIGWCYKRVSSDTRPRKFYGLSRANVRLQSANTADERERQ